MTHKPTMPYDLLHIYYLQGIIAKKTEPTIDENFLGNWQEDGFSFLFFSKASDHIVEDILKENTKTSLLDKYCMTYEAWQGGEITPVSIGKFLISPPWAQSCKHTDPGAKPIQMTMDPGVVFGTGTHPTTNHCLELLGDLCSRERIDSVLDLGTGTGVLSVAAGHLGCSQVVAVDFNYLAALTTKKNIVLNRLEGKVWPVQGMAQDYMNLDTDLLIANIHFDVMQHLIENPGFLKEKWFILSGLLTSQAEEVAYRLSQMPVEVLEVRGRGEIWHTFFGRTAITG